MFFNKCFLIKHLLNYNIIISESKNKIGVINCYLLDCAIILKVLSVLVKEYITHLNCDTR